MRTLCVVLVLATFCHAGTMTLSTADNEYNAGILNQESHNAPAGGGNPAGTTGVGLGNSTAWEFYVGPTLPQITGATLLLPTGASLGGTGVVDISLRGIVNYGPYDALTGQDLSLEDDVGWPGDVAYPIGSLLMNTGGNPSAMISVPLTNMAYVRDDYNGWIGIYARQSGGDNCETLIGQAPAYLTLTTVPEPTSAVLCLVSLGLLAFWSFKRWLMNH